MTPAAAVRTHVLRSATWAYGAAALLAVLLRPGLRAVVVPAAGPWAARVYGHG